VAAAEGVCKNREKVLAKNKMVTYGNRLKSIELSAIFMPPMTRDHRKSGPMIPAKLFHDLKEAF